MRNRGQHASKAWSGQADEKPSPETLAITSQTEVYAASKELLLGVFGEQVFRIGQRLNKPHLFSLTQHSSILI